MKTQNNYQRLLTEKLFDKTPKAVFAALAVSGLSNYGDELTSDMDRIILKEWWILFHNGIVPQKPPFPEPV